VATESDCLYNQADSWITSSTSDSWALLQAKRAPLVFAQPQNNGRLTYIVPRADAGTISSSVAPSPDRTDSALVVPIPVPTDGTPNLVSFLGFGSEVRVEDDVLLVPEDVLARHGMLFDIRRADSKQTACFTKVDISPYGLQLLYCSYCTPNAGLRHSMIARAVI
jgi:hypothetical protein